ncbi:uncharacterized protein At4g04980 [Daucus carota subsp. sativus]|nr:PREDICTED: uncharacterized protein At4g04980 [Daucus carota subsp. sativus]
MLTLISIIVSCFLLILINKRQASRFCSSFDKIDRFGCGRGFLFAFLFKSCARNSAMAAATCRPASPLNSSKKNLAIKLPEKDHLKRQQSSDMSKMLGSSPRGWSPGGSPTMSELRNKILTFRDKLDLPPCNVSASVLQLVIVSVNDLHKLYPDVVAKNSMSETKGTSMNQALNAFCDAMRAVGDMWTNSNKWIESTKYSLVNADLEQLALSMLDDMIKLVKEKMSTMMDEDEDEDMKRCIPLGNGTENSSSESSTDRKTPQSESPLTPTSVLPPLRPAYSVPLLPVRLQSIGKLNPIDLKRLAFHFPQEASQDFHPLNDMYKTVEEAKAESEAKRHIEEATDTKELDSGLIIQETSVKRNSSLNQRSSPKRTAKSNLSIQPTASPKAAKMSSTVHPLESPKGSPIREKNSASTRSSVEPMSSVERSCLRSNSCSGCSTKTLSIEEQLPAHKHSNKPSNSATKAKKSQSLLSILVPPAPPSVASKEVINSPTVSTPVLPPPPPPTPTIESIVLKLPSSKTPKNVAISQPPPQSIAVPPPPSMPMTKGNMTAPPPPPPPLSSNGSAPPPPPMSLANRGAPPPPPGGGKFPRPMKGNSKLRRSSQIGNLYRQLKGKVEGSSLDGKSSQGRKGNTGSGASGGNQGLSMADALAEMTKRSSYFQQIEEDVKNHAEAIKEVKRNLSSFQATDMKELIKFHRDIESHLEKLTDESQVLARFEDFPTKKLEAVRMAAALYSKLEGIVNTLQNWKIVSPLNQLLDKVENYFSKIKGELDTLERTKDEESKKFQSHKIVFDFGILVRIKELMVDVSANCMELALKERREAKAKQLEVSSPRGDGKKMVSAKMLWRAFQFAFRVYTFAGGHDERADKLTRELAHEIETDPQ